MLIPLPRFGLHIFQVVRLRKSREFDRLMAKFVTFNVVLVKFQKVEQPSLLISHELWRWAALLSKMLFETILVISPILLRFLLSDEVKWEQHLAYIPHT